MAARPITSIYIACYIRDVWMARTCVASIRYWYPDIDIFLFKDTGKGDFSTDDLEHFWNVKLVTPEHKTYGWGMPKFELFSMDGNERFLFLDADTVLTGPLLDKLATIDADIVISPEPGFPESLHNLAPDRREFMILCYYDPEQVLARDPGFEFPGFLFNTGQLVWTAGKFSKADFAPFLAADGWPAVREPGVFGWADQGVINYLAAKAKTAGKVSIAVLDFFDCPSWQHADPVTVRDLKERKGTPRVIHWAGPKPASPDTLRWNDVFRFYEDYFYSKIPQGRMRRRLREWARIVQTFTRESAKRLLKRTREQRKASLSPSP